MRVPGRPNKDQRRLELLSVARDLFAVRGFSGTSIRDIAKAANIESASLYYYFASKSELFVAVHQYGIDRIYDAVAEAIATAKTPWSRLEAAAAAHCRELVSKEGFSVMIMPSLPADIDAATHEKLAAQRDRYEVMITGLIKDLELPLGVDPGLFKQALLGCLNWTAVWYKDAGVFNPEQIGREFVQLLAGKARLS